MLSLTRVLLSSLAHLGSFTAVREDRLEFVHSRGLVHYLLPSLKQFRPCITSPATQRERVERTMAIHTSTLRDTEADNPLWLLAYNMLP